MAEVVTQKPSVRGTAVTNPNFLNPGGFEVVVRRLPYTTFYCQTVVLPSYTVERVDVHTPFKALNLSATAPVVGDFSMTFKVDEKMKNYTEIVNWIKGVSFPESFEQYADNKARNGREALRSDATLMVLASNKVPSIAYTIYDLTPVSVGPLTFLTTDQDHPNFVGCTATFSIRDMELTDVQECIPAVE